MEFHQLRYFVAVAEEGSFSRAAARERVAQPSLSQQVRKLEFEMGQPLFDRLPRGATLTRAGAQFLVHAKRILSEAADARHSLASTSGELSGTIVMGIIPTIAPFLLPAVLSDFTSRHARVSIDIVEDPTASLLRQLDVGDLDFAVISTASASSSRLEPIGSEALLVLLTAGCAHAAKRQLSWSDLANERFLILHEMHCLSGQVSKVCQQHHLEPRIAFKGAQLETVARMVASGAGVSLVPAMMAATDHSQRRVYRPLCPPQPTRSINLAWNPHRHRAAPAVALARTLRDVFEGLTRVTHSPASEHAERQRRPKAARR
jgi:LysR family hydrogen peroxide-inducible transcriptional activator